MHSENLEDTPPAGPQQHRARFTGVVELALIAWVMIVITRNAWLSDDSFISFRIVHNFVEGRGMTWNPGQRVQAFTHPAWFFIVAAAHALTHEMYYTALTVSLVVAGIGLWFAVRWVAREPSNVWPALLALGFSRAFIDFSTSGLENVLAHLLLFTALSGLIRATSPEGLRSPWLDLNFALLALNRLDHALLVAPTWAWLMWRRWHLKLPPRRLLVHCACLATPLLAWWLFSLFYFGFALPNTAYAKLGITVPSSARLAQGLLYSLTLIATDPTSALLLAVGLGGALHAREGWQRPMLLGALAYLLYVIDIGGDFMSGRFFSAPLIIATATLLRAPLERTQSLALGALFVIVGLSSPTPPPLSGVAAEGRVGGKVEVVRNRVVDERRYYHADTGLLTADRERQMPGGPYRDVLARAGERGIIVPKLGMRGFLARPDTVLIDGYGLTDPFLARMPYPPELIKSNWTAGHFKRPKPEGYVESVKSGENLLKDPKLARFYSQMQLITTGPLWSTARLRAIWRLNTGQYNAWTKGQAGSLEVEQDDDL